MAIYHLEAKVISRGAGKSACAASAYLSCSQNLNDYDGILHDYTRKSSRYYCWNLRRRNGLTGLCYGMRLKQTRKPKTADWQESLWWRYPLSFLFNYDIRFHGASSTRPE